MGAGLPTSSVATGGGNTLVVSVSGAWTFVFESSTSLYVADDSSIATANVRHAVKTGSTWAVAGSISLNTTSPIYSITGRTEGGAFVLYACSPSVLYRYDTVASAASIVATASPSTLFRGVALPPRNATFLVASVPPSFTGTASPTASQTASSTNTATQTASQTPTPTQTSSPSSTTTSSASLSVGATPSNSGSATASATATSSSSRTQSNTRTGSITPSSTPSSSHTASFTPTGSRTPSYTPTPSRTPSPTNRQALFQATSVVVLRLGDASNDATLVSCCGGTAAVGRPPCSPCTSLP